MKLQPDPQSALNTVTRYEDDHIEINAVKFNHSLLVMPEGKIETWAVYSFEDLLESHFLQISEKRPELVIFGSGSKIRFPNPTLLKPILQLRIGIETMDTQAACRTYNILMGEGRKVLGAFLIGN
ncbi:MAG: Mth938-like domain-containing protein [Betaproteobacteria bacterium]